jgi:transcriptional regulator with XRE-family HTH domain
MIAPWNNIDRARRTKGLNLKELARLVGVSETAVQYWKHGKTISLDTIAKLAVVLDTSVDTLLAFPEKPASSDMESPKHNAIRETPPPYGSDLDVVAIIETMPDEALQGTFDAAVETGKVPLAGALGAEMARRKKQKQEPTGWEDKKK